MRRLSNLLAVMAIIAGFISLTIVTGASAKDIKVGAVINLTGPASTWGQFHPSYLICPWVIVEIRAYLDDVVADEFHRLVIVR